MPFFRLSSLRRTMMVRRKELSQTRENGGLTGFGCKPQLARIISQALVELVAVRADRGRSRLQPRGEGRPTFHPNGEKFAKQLAAHSARQLGLDWRVPIRVGQTLLGDCR